MSEGPQPPPAGAAGQHLSDLIEQLSQVSPRGLGNRHLDLPASRLQLAKAIAQFAQLHMVQATLAGALARKDKVQLEEQTKLLVDGLKKAIELVAELARRPEARKPQASEE